MKRSQINTAYRQAKACFQKHHWALPPSPKWDITDFGLGEFRKYGLILINLAEEPEYCEKLMYARKGQVTPCHTHRRKKEDIICRNGELVLELWPDNPEKVAKVTRLEVCLNGKPRAIDSGCPLTLPEGSRVTLLPGIWHTFYPESSECIIGEVSTANDDAEDNFFLDSRIGRFPKIIEDEPAEVRLVSEYDS